MNDWQLPLAIIQGIVLVLQIVLYALGRREATIAFASARDAQRHAVRARLARQRVERLTYGATVAEDGNLEVGG